METVSVVRRIRGMASGTGLWSAVAQAHWLAGFSGTGVQAHCGQVDGKFGLAGLDTACDLVQPCSIPFNPIGTLHDADGKNLLFRSFPLIAGGSSGLWDDGQW